MATSAWLHGAAAMRLTEGLVCVLKEQRPEYLPNVLESYREHGVFSLQSSNDAAALIGHSNAKLSSSKTRFEGLCLLSVLVKDSSSELFHQHCLSWLRAVQQVIQSQAPVQTIQLAVNVLKDLLQYSCQQPELAREVGLNSILGILTSLLDLKTECELTAMEGMKACMIYYPRACGSLKDKLAAYFLSKMDNTNKNTQEMASEGYSRLPCLGGLLDRSAGASKADGWTNQVHCLLASANSILSLMYHGSEMDEAVQYRGPGVELALPPLDETDPLLLLQLQHRFAAVCSAIKNTLRTDPSSAVHLPVRPILNLVCRALAFTPKNINLAADGGLKLLLLPRIHINTLEVLSELITVVRSCMVQYSAVIQRLFSQTLSAWTPLPDTTVGQQRAYSLVRVSVYKTLEIWVQVVGASASILQGASSPAELLFNHLLGDITPGAESIKLRVGLSSVDIVPGGKPGPRRTKQLVITDTVGSSLQRKGESFSNQDTCLSALRALRHIIQTSGTLLKDEMHKRLHELVLPICVRMQQQQSSSIIGCEPAGGVSGQYSSALTRKELYRLLLALVLVPSPCWAPPTTAAVSIFSNGRTDHHIKVSSFCAEALTICNSILHSRTPSIALSLPPLTLKPAPTSSVLSCQGPTPRMTLPTLLGPPFPTRHPLGLGTNSLLESLENNLSLVPGLTSQASTAGDLMLSPQTHYQTEPSGLGPADGQRPVFVRYDKEEAEDVEISLASDSDDSVVIVPPGMLSMENQKDESVANAQNMLSTAPVVTSVTLAGAETVTMVPTTAVPNALNVTPLPDEMVTSAALLTTSSTPISSFPPSITSVVSLVPSLNTSSVLAQPGGLGDSLPGKPQLQQMLMQPSTVGQSNPMTLPLQMHQLQNQLAQQGRHIHQHPPTLPNKEESAVININSSDDEEEDEDDIEDDEELEEDGLDEEDEEEEGSDEFYDGEEYEDFEEEEGEELEEEEEEEEDGDIPPLEGSEEKIDLAKEEKILEAPVEEEEAEYDVTGEGEEGGGIEELQTSSALLGEDRMQVQEVESIGVLEEAREGENDEREEMDDPTLPQILCVTGGALEKKFETSVDVEAGEEPQENMVVWDQGAEESEPPVATGEPASAHIPQHVPDDERAQEDTVGDDKPLDHPEEKDPAELDKSSVKRPDETSSGPSEKEQELMDEEQGKVTLVEILKSDEDEEGGEGKGDEEKGMKRKREDEDIEESPEKKKVEEEAMASMLADFVACPPDDDVVTSEPNTT